MYFCIGAILAKEKNNNCAEILKSKLTIHPVTRPILNIVKD